MENIKFVPIMRIKNQQQTYLSTIGFYEHKTNIDDVYECVICYEYSPYACITKCCKQSMCGKCYDLLKKHTGTPKIGTMSYNLSNYHAYDINCPMCRCEKVKVELCDKILRCCDCNKQIETGIRCYYGCYQVKYGSFV